MRAGSNHHIRSVVVGHAVNVDDGVLFGNGLVDSVGHIVITLINVVIVERDGFFLNYLTRGGTTCFCGLFGNIAGMWLSSLRFSVPRVLRVVLGHKGHMVGAVGHGKILATTRKK